jgi:hypothetical protein
MITLKRWVVVLLFAVLGAFLLVMTYCNGR